MKIIAEVMSDILQYNGLRWEVYINKIKTTYYKVIQHTCKQKKKKKRDGAPISKILKGFIAKFHKRKKERKKEKKNEIIPMFLRWFADKIMFIMNTTIENSKNSLNNQTLPGLCLSHNISVHSLTFFRCHKTYLIKNTIKTTKIMRKN